MKALWWVFAAVNVLAGASLLRHGHTELATTNAAAVSLLLVFHPYHRK